MIKRICEISNRILHCTSLGLPRLDFIREVAATILDFCEGDAVTIFLGDRDRLNSFEFELPNHFSVKTLSVVDFPFHYYRNNRFEQDNKANYFEWVERFFKEYVHNCHTKNKFAKLNHIVGEDGICFYVLDSMNRYQSYYLIPFVFDKHNYSLIVVKAIAGNAFSRTDISFLSKLFQVLSDSFSHQYAQDALKERVKELTCLYQITQIANRPNYTIPQIIQAIVEVLPSAMQYPEIANARFFIDGEYYHSKHFKQSHIRLQTDISTNYEQRGLVEIFYTENKLPKYSKIFLPEEESLIETVSKQVALLIERKQVEVQNKKLQEQLRHADRLATIGQLSAGIAHEINEPLGTILGFAQLIEENNNLTQDDTADIRRIINAALHGREIIRKLMLFSRQMPPKKGRINVNQIIEDGLYFLSSRCSKSGIEIEKRLEPKIPQIDADPNQIHQILVNLMVNAIHSMPDGGKLTLSTRKNNDKTISILVSDTGVGIPEDIQQKIFIPFFTTKDINEGTGLGLSVVHGIVTSHNGKIIVDSRVDKGSEFEIRLPASTT